MKKYSNKILIGYIIFSIIAIIICTWLGIKSIKKETNKPADTTDIYDTSNVPADTATGSEEFAIDTMCMAEV